MNGPFFPSTIAPSRLPQARPRSAAFSSGRRHVLLLSLVAAAGVCLFLLGLGATGVVDETPALFAASARHMAESGDWLIPQVNGLPRYDKPPLVYWLMAALYALPDADHWDPLGSRAARLPSALATIATMVLLADTLLRWPQPQGGAPDPSGRSICALSAPLAFALSPLVLIWGRTEVSDGLFTATLAFSLLLAWRTYAAPRGPWWPCWLALALAILSKGPVALVLFALTLVLFWALGADAPRLRRRLRPLRGLGLVLAVGSPWYALALMREGHPYWESFFGYHNLQRYTRVVNNHQQAWWFFLAMLLLASLPFTPLLLAGLRRFLLRSPGPLPAAESLGLFAAVWLLAVLVFFSLSATKLPSYWLVATPAAALLVPLAAGEQPRPPGWALATSWGLLSLVAACLVGAHLWLPLIDDPTLPGLQAALETSPALPLGAAIALLAALLLAGLTGQGGRPSLRLLHSQAALVLLVPLLILPIWQIGDELRGEPIRQLAAVARESRTGQESLAMVGLMKPSLHFYSRATVLYEGQSATGLINLADRLRSEGRPGLQPAAAARQPTFLLVIDEETARQPHWQGWRGQELARASTYQLRRVELPWLEERARLLSLEGLRPTWRNPRPERL